MNNNKQIEQVVNVREIIWELLSQWKAVLIVAILVMIILPVLKYTKDLKAFDISQNSSTAEEESYIAFEQKVEEILKALPEDERETVVFLSKQEDWLKEEKEYINNSILMNTNPANQRTLTLEYLISTDSSSESNIISLTSGYLGYLSNEAFVSALGQAIDPDVSSKYIAELIKTNNSPNHMSNDSNALYVNADKNASVISVYIVLPEEADVLAVESAVTTAFKDYSKELSSKIGQHTISFLQSGESYQYNADLITSFNNVLYSVNNLTNNTKNMKTALSDAQKAAFESITAIKKAEANENSSSDKSKAEEATRPGFSKKYALLGFVIGIFVYALVYVFMVIMKGCVNCAADTKYYTQSRLLGEVYGDKKNKGISKLFHSRFIEKFRYRGKTDDEVQIKKTVEAMGAVYEHAQINNLTILDMSREADRYMDSLLEGVKDMGLSVEIIDAVNDFKEKSLLSTDNAVLVTGPDTKVSVLSELISLCSDYGVSSLGSIFIDPTALS